MPYTVTRQHQWPDGAFVVEVSKGGRDYTNPDALGAKYPGEFETYDDPVEAVETAIAICNAWRKDGERRAKVAHGATGGMTMPFSPCTFAELRAWAQQRREALPRCDRCGDILPAKPYVNCFDGDGRYCSAYCAEESIPEMEREGVT